MTHLFLFRPSYFTSFLAMNLMSSSLLNWTVLPSGPKILSSNPSPNNSCVGCSCNYYHSTLPWHSGLTTERQLNKLFKGFMACNKALPFSRRKLRLLLYNWFVMNSIRFSKLEVIYLVKVTLIRNIRRAVECFTHYLKQKDHIWPANSQNLPHNGERHKLKG